MFRPLANQVYLRNFIFGVEDSLVSTVGLLSGIAVSDVPRATIVLTGMTLIFVEAFAMAVGSFLSEESTEEYMRLKRKVFDRSFKAGSVMFLSYFLAGAVPLAPYVLDAVERPLPLSVSLSLLALFALGLASGSIIGTNAARRGLKMMVLGGIAIAVGAAVGSFVTATGI